MIQVDFSQFPNLSTIKARNFDADQATVNDWLTQVASSGNTGTLNLTGNAAPGRLELESVLANGWANGGGPLVSAPVQPHINTSLVVDEAAPISLIEAYLLNTEGSVRGVNDSLLKEVGQVNLANNARGGNFSNFNYFSTPDFLSDKDFYYIYARFFIPSSITEGFLYIFDLKNEYYSATNLQYRANQQTLHFYTRRTSSSATTYTVGNPPLDQWITFEAWVGKADGTLAYSRFGNEDYILTDNYIYYHPTSPHTLYVGQSSSTNPILVSHLIFADSLPSEEARVQLRDNPSFNLLIDSKKTQLNLVNYNTGAAAELEEELNFYASTDQEIISSNLIKSGVPGSQQIDTFSSVINASDGQTVYLLVESVKEGVSVSSEVFSHTHQNWLGMLANMDLLDPSTRSLLDLALTADNYLIYQERTQPDFFIAVEVNGEFAALVDKTGSTPQWNVDGTYLISDHVEYKPSINGVVILDALDLASNISKLVLMGDITNISGLLHMPIPDLEIRQYQTPLVLLPDLLGWWDFEGNLIDSANGHSFTVYGGGSISYGANGVDLSADDSILSIHNNPAFDNLNTSGFYIAFEIVPTGWSSYVDLFTQTNGNFAREMQFMIRAIDSNSTLSFYGYEGNESDNEYTFRFEQIPRPIVNNKTLIEIFYDPSIGNNGRAGIALNRSEFAEQDLALPLPGFTTATHPISFGGNYYSSDPDQSLADRQFTGSFRKIAIWNSVPDSLTEFRKNLFMAGPYR